jgi:hypothetical protein
MAANHFLADGNLNPYAGRLDGNVGIPRLPKRRQNDDRFVSQPSQLTRQRPANVAEAASLREGRRFSGGEQNIHALIAPLGN